MFLSLLVLSPLGSPNFAVCGGSSNNSDQSSFRFQPTPAIHSSFQHHSDKSTISHVIFPPRSLRLLATFQRHGSDAETLVNRFAFFSPRRASIESLFGASFLFFRTLPGPSESTINTPLMPARALRLQVTFSGLMVFVPSLENS